MREDHPDAKHIYDLLKTIEPKERETRRPDTLSQAFGLLATDHPAPDDEEVACLIEKHKIR